jgi:hypothetical protein
MLKKLDSQKKQSLPPQITLRLWQPIPFDKIHEEFSVRNHPKPAKADSLWRATNRIRQLSPYHGHRLRVGKKGFI